MARVSFEATLIRPYTHRLEYARWIEEARRPETRTRRVEVAVERIRESRPAR